MKKIIIGLSLVICSFSLMACSLTKSTAKDAVKIFLDQYKNLASNVLGDLEKVIDEEDFTKEQEDKYRDILKKQYSDLKYEIVSESYDGSTATVKAKITVYDLYKAQDNATKYLNEHQDEFLNEFAEIDTKKFLDYKLDQMQKMNDTVEYTINFNVVKGEDDKWQVQELSKSDLEKIHGIYNYDTNS